MCPSSSALYMYACYERTRIFLTTLFLKDIAPKSTLSQEVREIQDRISAAMQVIIEKIAQNECVLS